MKLSISQNFLINKDLVKSLIIKSKFSKDLPILDIGVGRGIISKILLELGYKVIGFELDKNMALKASQELINYENFKMINEDFLAYNDLNFSFNVFSNIPFNQTSKIIEKLFLKNKNAYKSYLVVQKESAERLLGLKEGLFLSLQLENFNSVEIFHNFQKTDFYPVPRVNSVLLKIEKRQSPIINNTEYKFFLDFISYLILQQKPSLLRRLEKVIKYDHLKSISSLLDIDLSKTLYDIPKLKYFEMYKIIKQQYPLVLFHTKDYYKKYIEINSKNIKNYRTRIAK